MKIDDLRTTIASAFSIPPEHITDDSSSSTISQWDSIGHLNLIAALEAHFDTSFTVDEILEMRNVAAIRSVLEAKLGPS
jgi:acyl carrier protein